MKNADEFWDNVDIRGEEECWIWQSYVDKRSGYGQATWLGKKHNAHRIAYITAYNCIIPDDIQVCHSCDNRVCCNPNHLWLGTSKENTWDKMSKGRHGNTSIVINWSIVHYIRSKYANSIMSTRDLSREIGITDHAISLIIRNKSWHDPNYIPSIPDPSSRARCAKINWDIAREIRTLYSNGMKYIDIANRFNISRDIVEGVVRNLTWKE